MNRPLPLGPSAGPRASAPPQRERCGIGEGTPRDHGERVPTGTRWTGNPIGPWADDDAPLDGTADEHDDEDDAREREHMEERA